MGRYTLLSLHILENPCNLSFFYQESEKLTQALTIPSNPSLFCPPQSSTSTIPICCPRPWSSIVLLCPKICGMLTIRPLSTQITRCLLSYLISANFVSTNLLYIFRSLFVILSNFLRLLRLILEKMSPRSVLVTGGNRGIGLGLVKELLKDKGIQHIIATARKPDEAKELKEVTDSRLHLVALEVDNDDSIGQAYSQVSFPPIPSLKITLGRENRWQFRIECFDQQRRHLCALLERKEHQPAGTGPSAEHKFRLGRCPHPGSSLFLPSSSLLFRLSFLS